MLSVRATKTLSRVGHLAYVIALFRHLHMENFNKIQSLIVKKALSTQVKKIDKMEQKKPVHTLVLDTGAIIRNEPSVSTLIGQSESLITVPAIISEIRDATTRSRVETTLMPFLKLRTPTAASMKFVTDFARRTGDLAVLSKPDLQIIALTYEIDCERNGGDWRLKKMPGQKQVNGAPPTKNESKEQAPAEQVAGTQPKPFAPAPAAPWAKLAGGGSERPTHIEADKTGQSAVVTEKVEPATEVEPETSIPDGEEKTDGGVALDSTPDMTDRFAEIALEDTPQPTEPQPAADSEAPKIEPTQTQATTDSAEAEAEAESDAHSSDDGGGWITPSNLKRKQAADNTTSSKLEITTPEESLQVAVLTTDYAMQNVLLQIGLHLISPSLHRIRHLKTHILRCQACFQTTKEMSRQFCSKCGKPTLTKVSCSTSANGEFKLHLKRNFQFNNKGERYSIPKAVHGSANGRVKGAGKGHWGNELILAEDQKEYQRAVGVERKTRERGLMDEDYLPGILTGERGRMGGRIKVGAGRNVNSKKR